MRHQLSEDDAGTLKTSPQARKKFDGLRNTQVSTALFNLDAMQFPYEEVVNVYVERWEIELGFREMKQTLHQAKLCAARNLRWFDRNLRMMMLDAA